MKQFTVTWWLDAQNDLANLWMTAVDPGAVTRAADEIDRLLARDPTSVIEAHHEGLCRLTVGPLMVQYSIDDADRKVTVWAVRRRDVQSAGP
jgi:hypothetical protein